MGPILMPVKPSLGALRTLKIARASYHEIFKIFHSTSAINGRSRTKRQGNQSNLNLSAKVSNRRSLHQTESPRQRVYQQEDGSSDQTKIFSQMKTSCMYYLTFSVIQRVCPIGSPAY